MVRYLCSIALTRSDQVRSWRPGSPVYDAPTYVTRRVLIFTRHGWRMSARLLLPITCVLGRASVHFQYAFRYLFVPSYDPCRPLPAVIADI